MGFFQEFKTFAMRGNVVDLAVAVIIGAAFGKIITSLVDGIVMPLLGLLLGGINVANKTFVFGQATIKWGMFLQTVIDFTIIAFAIFSVLKLINTIDDKLEAKKQEADEQKQSEEVLLLTEIRDLLRKQNN